MGLGEQGLGLGGRGKSQRLAWPQGISARKLEIQRYGPFTFTRQRPWTTQTNIITVPPACLWEIGLMNVGRGLFRAWIFLTVLWIIGAGALGYFIIWDEVSSWKWRYLTVLRQGVEWGDLMNRPYYENTPLALRRKAGCHVS